MCKRFTDTNIWDQSWFIELSPEGKNIWQFLEKSADSAGIWKIDIPEMKRKIGYKEINLKSFLKEVNRDYNKLTGEAVKRNRVMLIANDTKLWLTGFISFQYEKGTSGVNAGIPAIKGALNRLRDENIYAYAVKEGFVRVKGEGVIDSDLNSSSENDSRGCRGSARDKDKDKDRDQEVLRFQDLNREEKEEGNVHQEREKNAGEEKSVGTERAFRTEKIVEAEIAVKVDKVELLFKEVWGKQNKLPEERRLVNEFITKYGFGVVEFAFREGVKYNKMSLAYVDAICKKRKEKADLAEYKDRDKKKLHEAILRAEEQRKSGKCLKLVGGDKHKPLHYGA